MSVGPDVKIEMSCTGCDVCTSEHYVCQSDSGYDIYCNHLLFVNKPNSRKRIGTSRDTPTWCPAYVDSSNLQHEIKTGIEEGRFTITDVRETINREFPKE